MPTYTYRRPDGTVFDVFQRITDDALTEDPETGEPIERVISGGAGLQFKGTGFYLTDYVKKSGSPDAGGSSAKTSSASASEGGSVPSGTSGSGGNSSSASSGTTSTPTPSPAKAST